VQVLKEKPGTKRPAIVAAATALFAKVGVMRPGCGTQPMRQVCAKPQSIATSSARSKWRRRSSPTGMVGYGQQVRQIVEEKHPLRKKLRAPVHLEFETALTHPQELFIF
jgi:hypothetical protein